MIGYPWFGPAVRSGRRTPGLRLATSDRGRPDRCCRSPTSPRGSGSRSTCSASRRRSCCAPPAYDPQQRSRRDGTRLVPVDLDPDSLRPHSTSTGSTSPSRPVRARCCSPSRTTRPDRVLQARGARGDPRRRHQARRPCRLRRDPRPAGAARRGARAVPVAARHRRRTRSRSSPRRRRSTSPGSSCAQLVTADDATRDRLVDVPMVRRTTRGARSAWWPRSLRTTDGDAWLAALIERLDELRTLLGEVFAGTCPEARMRPLEATYIAWLDLRAYGHDDPAEVVLGGGVGALTRSTTTGRGWPATSGSTSPRRRTAHRDRRRMRGALTGSR